MATPLSEANLGRLAPQIARPGYSRAGLTPGILHVGLGNFHRAHQAVYLDDLIAKGGASGWGILGAGVMPGDAAMRSDLEGQDWLYSVSEQDADGDAVRVIGAMTGFLPVEPGHGAIIRALADPAIRILSLTVSEKAYGIDREAMDIDPTHPAVAADLSNANTPQGVLGIIAAASAARHAAGQAPFTVLCCDNLPDNGALLRAGVLGLARRLDPDLAARIADQVAFPATMVDRITPAVTDRSLADVEHITGHRDLACVETEPFTQWVIEDHFPHGRPAWEAGGAEFVRDVAPYEAMKLRMLNGSHSLIACLGQMLGLRYVRDVVADDRLSALISRLMRAAADSLPRGAGLDPDSYGRALMTRFANPAIAHETRQIAMDATEKLPQRWFAPAAEVLARGGDLQPYAFATAVWLAWLSELGQRGTAPNDPRGAQLMELVAAAGTDAGALTRSVLALPGLVPAALTGSASFMQDVAAALRGIRRNGLRAAIDAQLAG